MNVYYVVFVLLCIVGTCGFKGVSSSFFYSRSIVVGHGRMLLSRTISNIICMWVTKYEEEIMIDRKTKY